MKGRSPRLSPVEVRRVVLDARADAGLLEHLEVVLGARAQALGLEELALGLEEGQLLGELLFDRRDRPAAGWRGSWRSARRRTA